MENQTIKLQKFENVGFSKTKSKDWKVRRGLSLYKLDRGIHFRSQFGFLT